MTPIVPENSAYSSAPILDSNTKKRRPWWQYAVGGCGCLTVMTVVGLAVIIFGFSNMLENAPEVLAGSAETQARAQKTAEEFLNLAGRGKGDEVWEMMSPQYRAHHSDRDFTNILQNIIRSTKRRQRSFNKIEGGLVELSPDDEGVNLGTVLHATFLYRSKADDDTIMCVVYLIDPATYREKSKKGQKFKVYQAGCGERSKIEKLL